MSRIEHLNDCFYKGKYSSVVTDLGRELISTLDPNFETLTCLQIGSLVFLGESMEAQCLFKLALNTTTPSDLFICRCRFYLGISFAQF